MIQPLPEPQDERLGEIAARFVYPPTPGISREVRAAIQPRRRALRAWQVIVLAVFVLLAALFAVPQVRAFLGQYFRVGAVRILPFGPTATAPLHTPVSPLLAGGTEEEATPRPVPTEGRSTLSPLPARLANLAGRTTLDQAGRTGSFPLLLPTYPPDLGPPDYVFRQGESPMLIFAWADPDDPRGLRLSLFAIDSRAPMATKFHPRVIEETSVNGQYALWVEGPYVLELTNENYVERYLVEGGTLVWEADGVTYRLETHLTLEEAIRIAESLRPVEP
jgi:hypothetical protein